MASGVYTLEPIPPVESDTQQSTRTLYQHSVQALQAVPELQVTEAVAFYLLKRNAPQCVDTYRSIRYQAPDRIALIVRDCNPVGVRKTSRIVQMGQFAWERNGSYPYDNQWKRVERSLFVDREGHRDIGATLLQFLHLPPTRSVQPVNHAPEEVRFDSTSRVTIDIRGHAIETWLVSFIVQHPSRHPARPVPDQTTDRNPPGYIEEGTAVFDIDSWLPITYTSRTHTRVTHGRGVLAARTRVKFRYFDIRPIQLPLYDR